MKKIHKLLVDNQIYSMVWYITLGVITGIILKYGSYNYGYRRGLKSGYEVGVNITLNQVDSIVKLQLGTDSTVTKLSMELDSNSKKDTVSYFLSPKSILNAEIKQ